MENNHYYSIKNKGIIITGGASGIGAACCESLINQGAYVAILDNNQDAANLLLNKFSETNRIIFKKLDLKNIDELNKTIVNLSLELPNISILINSAARDDRDKVDEISVENWDEMLATNLRHVFFATRTVAKFMKITNGGSVVNFSTTAWIKKSNNLTCYSTAKTAIIGLTRSLAREYGIYNIRVNSIMPGWVVTKRQKELWLTKNKANELIKGQCIKKLIYPKDVANLVNFLVSDDSNMITGQNFTIDGGMT